ncbi:MAG: carbohydrate ABC transporter permease [Thomasclavelia spiroformis]|jgi:ABC transporter, permease protein|nr:aBC transporter permease [Staphylococcus sp. CAG:324]
MARKDKNYVFKDSNEDQRKVKVSKRVNWMKKKAIEEQKQAQSNQEQIVKNDFALDQKETLEVNQEVKNEDMKVDTQQVADDSIAKLETSDDQSGVKVETTKTFNDLNKNPIQLDFEEKEKAYLDALKETEKAALKLRIEKERGSVIRKIDRWSKRGGRLRREIFVKRQYYYLVAPYTILFFIFTVVPVLMSLVLSFTYFNLLEFPTFVGWDNYKSLFVDDKVFMIALKNTAILAVITGPVSYIMAFVFAWLINELKPLLRSFMTLIFYAPSISGNVYLVWKLIFSSDNYGYANSMLMELNIIQEPITWLQDPDYIIWILIIVQLWMSLGVSFLSFIAGLQGVNKEYYEAGAIDGIKSRWQELWYITLPQMKSQLMFGAVMQITSSLAIAEVSINIAGFPSIEYAGHTIITHLMDYGNTRMEMGYASAIATILFLIMILANLLVRKILRRVGS